MTLSPKRKNPGRTYWLLIKVVNFSYSSVNKGISYHLLNKKPGEEKKIRKT